MITIYAQPSHFSAELGASEDSFESYIGYGEKIPQLATKLCAKNDSRVIGSADKQAGVVRRLYGEE